MSNSTSFSAKEIIFREGDDGDNAYIIQSGAVEILKHAEHGEVQLAVLEAGAVLGELALFEPKNKRSATARALNDVMAEVITDTQMKEMFAACPSQLAKIMETIIGRLRDTNRRLAAKERATVILDSDIDEITISGTDGLEGVFEPITFKAANLPYTIGGYPESEEKPMRNDLDLPCEGPPLMVSQKHAAIQRQEDGIYLVDVGARFCTIVNGKVIGRGKVAEKAPMQLGENKVTLGDYTSPYKLIITCT